MWNETRLWAPSGLGGAFQYMSGVSALRANDPTAVERIQISRFPMTRNTTSSAVGGRRPKGWPRLEVKEQLKVRSPGSRSRRY